MRPLVYTLSVVAILMHAIGWGVVSAGFTFSNPILYPIGAVLIVGAFPLIAVNRLYATHR